MTTKSLVKWGVRLVGVLAVVALALLLGLRVYGSARLTAAEKQFTAKVGSLDLATWTSPSVPEEQNAAVPIGAGALGVVVRDADKEVVGNPDRVGSSGWTPEQSRQLVAILEANAPALEMLHKAAGLNRSNFDIELDGATELQVVPLLKILWSARLLYAQALQARLDGDRATMLRAVETVSAVARAVHQEPLLICQLIGVAVERMMLGLVNQIATAPDVTPQELQRLEALIGTSDLHAAWKRSMVVPMLSAWAGAASLDRLDGTEQGDRIERIFARLVPSLPRAQALETAVTFIDLADRWFGTDWAAFERDGQMVGPSFRALIDKQRAEPGFLGVGRFQALRSDRRLTRVGLALRRQGIEIGTYPESLSAFPEAAEPDPFTGKALTYERHVTGSARLAVPEGEETWKKLSKGFTNSCPFTWELPAPLPTAGEPGEGRDRGAGDR